MAELQIRSFPPRDEVLQVLNFVLSDFQPLEEAVENFSTPLDARSKAWVWDITQTLFRYRGGIDFIIDQHALKKKPTGRIRKQLQIAIVQILFHKELSPEKVVSETVNWVKKDSGQQAGGFINVILRKISQDKEAWTEYLKGEFPDKIPSFWKKEMKKVHPDAWIKEFSNASLEMPPTWFRIRSNEIKQLPIEYFNKGFIETSFEWKGEPSTLGEFARRKDFLVQDLSSQILIKENIEEILKLNGDKELFVLDRCAAPGGKTVNLAWSLEEKKIKAQLFAFDTNEKRKQVLFSNFKDKNVEATILKEEKDFPENLNWIWLDAPCSGSGVVRRHPEMKWNKTEKDLDKCVLLEEVLLRDSWNRLPSGGFLTYTVCSVFPSEGLNLIKKCNLETYKLKEWILGPHLNPSTDGFYGILLRKP